MPTHSGNMAHNQHLAFRLMLPPDALTIICTSIVVSVNLVGEREKLSEKINVL
jgi:hypothetical protein